LIINVWVKPGQLKCGLAGTHWNSSLNVTVHPTTLTPVNVDLPPNHLPYTPRSGPWEGWGRGRRGLRGGWGRPGVWGGMGRVGASGVWWGWGRQGYGGVGTIPIPDPV